MCLFLYIINNYVIHNRWQVRIIKMKWLQRRLTQPNPRPAHDRDGANLPDLKGVPGERNQNKLGSRFQSKYAFCQKRFIIPTPCLPKVHAAGPMAKQAWKAQPERLRHVLANEYLAYHGGGRALAMMWRTRPKKISGIRLKTWIGTVHVYGWLKFRVQAGGFDLGWSSWYGWGGGRFVCLTVDILPPMMFEQRSDGKPGFVGGSGTATEYTALQHLSI